MNRKYRCGFCGRRGHTKPACPRFLYDWTQGMGGPGRAQPKKIKARKLKTVWRADPAQDLKLVQQARKRGVFK